MKVISNPTNCIFFVIILLTKIQDNMFVAKSRRVFPVQEFFMMAPEEINSCYLCSINPTEKKCCLCSVTPSNNDWCIDIAYDRNQKGLGSYMTHLESEYNSHKFFTDDYSCESILPESFRGKVEHMFMISRRSQTFEDCVDPLHKRAPIFASQMLYVNRNCAAQDYIESTALIDIEVQCTHDIGVIENTILNGTTAGMEKYCFLTVLNKEVRKLFNNHRCSFEKSNCPYNNVYYHLCQAYYAPTRGYKNYHCYLCQNMQSRETSFPLQKPNLECEGRFCNITYEKNIFQNFFIFELKAFDNGSYRVENITRRFPVWEFLRVLNNGKESIGHTEASIKNELCSMHTPKTCCSCDIEECMKFNTCCMDVMWDEKQSNNLEHYINQFIEISNRYKKQICQKLVPKSMRGNSYDMVSTCANGSDKYIIDKCESVSIALQSFLPVIAEDGLLYRNRYCAICNSVAVYKPISIRVGCTYSSLSISPDSCQFSIIRTNDSLINKCYESGDFHPELFDERCTAYDSYPFKNIHCDKCRRRHDLDKVIDLRFPSIADIQFDSIGKMSVIKTRDDLTILECDENDIFSIMLLQKSTLTNEICRNRTELFSKINKIDKCHINGLNLNLFIISSIATETLTKIRMLKILNTTHKDVKGYFRNETFVINQFNKTISVDELNGLIPHFYKLLSLFVKYADLQFVFIPAKKPVISESLSLLHTFNERHCEIVEIELLTMEDISQGCGLVENATKFDSYIYIDFNRYNFSINVAKCRLFEAHLDDQEPWKKTFQNAIVYLVASFSPLSLISYAILLLFITKTSSIESNHKKKIFSLFLCLMFADGVYFLSHLLHISRYDKIPYLCKVIGVIMQFDQFMILQWILVLGYILFIRCTYRRNTVNILKHSVVAVSIVSLLTAIIVILDEINAIQIQFGKNGICSLQGLQVRIFFHVIPTTVYLVGSLILVSISIYKSSTGIKVDKTDLHEGWFLLGIVLMEGLIEGIGFAQSNAADISLSTLITNLVYAFLRSVRGIPFLIFFVHQKDKNWFNGRKYFHSTEEQGTSNNLELN